MWYNRRCILCDKKRAVRSPEMTNEEKEIIMKTCWKCGMQNEDQIERCVGCGASLDEADGKKKVGGLRRKILMFIPLLVPAILMLIYDTLLWFGMIPSKIKMGGEIINLIELGDSGWLRIISVIALLILPLAFLGILCYLCFRDLGGVKWLQKWKEKSIRILPEKKETEEPVASAAPVEIAPEEMLKPFSYERLLKIDAEAHMAESSEYNNRFTLQEAADGFVRFAAARGLAVPARVSRSLFAALASVQVIRVSDRDKALTAKLFAALGEYLGSSAGVTTVESSWESMDRLLVVEDAKGNRSESNLLCDLYAATYHDKAVCITVLDGVSTKLAKGALASILSGESNVMIPLQRKEDGATPRNINSNVMKLPQNVWFVLRVSHGAVYFGHDNNAFIDLSEVTFASENKGENVAALGLISAKRLRDLAESADESYYIPEEYWKKLDALEEYICKRTGWELGNKTICWMENYASVYLACGGEYYELLDRLVVSVMLPQLLGCSKEELVAENDGLASLIDRVFGLDNMPLCNEFMKRISVH